MMPLSEAEVRKLRRLKMGAIKSHIEITPGVCGGKPRIAGHRIRVQDIVIMHNRMGKDPYEIINDYPSIT